MPLVHTDQLMDMVSLGFLDVTFWVLAYITCDLCITKILVVVILHWNNDQSCDTSILFVLTCKTHSLDPTAILTLRISVDHSCLFIFSMSRFKALISRYSQQLKTISNTGCIKHTKRLQSQRSAYEIQSINFNQK